MIRLTFEYSKSYSPPAVKEGEILAVWPKDGKWHGRAPRYFLMRVAGGDVRQFSLERVSGGGRERVAVACRDIEAHYGRTGKYPVLVKGPYGLRPIEAAEGAKPSADAYGAMLCIVAGSYSRDRWSEEESGPGQAGIGFGSAEAK
jgi:hypothetical protein